MADRHIIWPDNKQFAFTIIDDTDNSTVGNIGPVYQLLSDLNIRTTKTVWVNPPRDHFKGGCLRDPDYLNMIMDLQAKGFEIGLHNVGSGPFNRKEILEALWLYYKLMGEYPAMHINHSRNPDNLYWGYKRFMPPLRWMMQLLKSRRIFTGEKPDSDHFWGDWAKEHIQYMRNHVFNGINTLRYDPRMPYQAGNKLTYSNYWFSASDGHTVAEFNRLLQPGHIDRLEKERGCCIVYTHFAEGFVREGKLDEQFERQMKYLADKNGWFVPASAILDHLLAASSTERPASPLYLWHLDWKWILERWVKKIRFGR